MFRILAPLLALGLAAASWFLPPAAAELAADLPEGPTHEHVAYGGLDCCTLQNSVEVECRRTCDIWWNPNFNAGAFCLGPGHVTQNALGFGHVALSDVLFNPVSAASAKAATTT